MIQQDKAPTISVIVPVAPNEPLIESCLSELLKLPESFEIILASSKKPKNLNERFKFVEAKSSGRAVALNVGAKESTNDWLWFVHCDSKITTKVVDSLVTAIKPGQIALYYFQINYYDGTFKYLINEVGATLRSVLFSAPFGDQAFCVSKEAHKLIGDFSEDAKYGEDHLYVRAAKRANVPLNMLPHKIGTSARRHIEEGWLKVTLRYQKMWIIQALKDRPCTDVVAK